MANRLEKTVHVTTPPPGSDSGEGSGSGGGSGGGSSTPLAKTCQEQAQEQLQAIYPGRRIFHVDSSILPGGAVARVLVVMASQEDTWYVPGTFYVTQELRYTYACTAGSVVLTPVVSSSGTGLGHGTGGSGGVG